MVKRIIFYLIVSLGLVVFRASAANGPVSKLHEINQLIKAYKDTEALVKCYDLLKTDSLNYEVLCKTSLLNCRIGNRYSDETQKITYFSNAENYARKAIKIKPRQAEANYLLALAVSNLATTGNAKDRIAAAAEIKNYLDIALESNPKHAGAWHLLGRWNFRVANFNMAEITAANLLLGGVPEGATNEQAVAAIEKAIKYDPQNIIYYYDLARVYKESKKEDACLAILDQALCITPATNEDLEISRRCKIMKEQMVR